MGLRTPSPPPPHSAAALPPPSYEAAMAAKLPTSPLPPEDVAHAAVPSRNLNRSLSFPDTEASPPVTVALPTQPLSREEIQCCCQKNIDSRLFI